MITLVVGAQYGGEGKGKFCSYLASHQHFDLVCRTGGVNSSHTVRYDGAVHRLRMMPASAVVKHMKTIFGAGSLIHVETFLREMSQLGLPPSSIVVDERAGVIPDHMVESQRADTWYEGAGSTLTGTGYASAARSLRRLPLARDTPALTPFLGDAVRILYDAAKSGSPILIEGHQGAGLSNYHGDYPYTSSRDCTASGLLSELGLGLQWETEVILAVKLFPTRNHPGNLPGEFTPEQARAQGIAETGGGSPGIPDRERRVGRFELSDVIRSVMLNTPTYLALQGFDYAFPELMHAGSPDEMSDASKTFIKGIEQAVGVPVGIVSTGPDVRDTIDLRTSHRANARYCTG